MSYSKQEVIGLIEKDIRDGYLKKDVALALEHLSQNSAGFFSILRLLFPEIDMMGSFLTGKSNHNTTQNIMTFMKVIMSRIDSKYKVNAFFITNFVRHGLLHQHHPKRLKIGGLHYGLAFHVGYNISESNRRLKHLNWSKGTSKDMAVLNISINCFYEDVLAATDLLVQMIRTNDGIRFKKHVVKALKEEYQLFNRVSLKEAKQEDLFFIKEAREAIKNSIELP